MIYLLTAQHIAWKETDKRNYDKLLPSRLESSHDFDEVKLRNNPKHTSVTSMQHWSSYNSYSII